MWSKLLEVLNPYKVIQATNQSKNQFIDKIINDKTYGIFPPQTQTQEALDVLKEFLLSDVQLKDIFYMKHLYLHENTMINTVIVHNILWKYSKKYRKQLNKQYRKQIKNRKR